MNIFSNIGITELIVILLLALIVVGPERLPELGRQLAKGLRDLRRMYDNLSKDLGPELMSIQRTTQELRESVDSIRSIPQDAVKSVVKAAELEDTVQELKQVADSVGQFGQTVTKAGQAIKHPVNAAVSTARDALLPTKPEDSRVEYAGPSDSGAPASEQAGSEDLAGDAKVLQRQASGTGESAQPEPADQEPEVLADE